MNSFATKTPPSDTSVSRSARGAKTTTVSRDASGPTLKQTFAVTHIWGMHARPCAMLIRAIQPFDCTVTVQTGDHIANGRSILGLLSLAAGCHSRMTFTITGAGAREAMAVIEALFKDGFEEAYVLQRRSQSKAVLAG